METRRKARSEFLTRRQQEDWRRLQSRRPPESFQLEEKGPKIFVNLASISQIAVIDRNTHKVEKWKLGRAGQISRWPRRASPPDVCSARKPARLLVLDMDTGKVIASLPERHRHRRHVLRRDRKRIYVTSGEGYIFVYQQIDSDRYQSIAKIPTAIGRVPAPIRDR